MKKKTYFRNGLEGGGVKPTFRNSAYRLTVICFLSFFLIKQLRAKSIQHDEFFTSEKYICIYLYFYFCTLHILIMLIIK